ncbi:biogenesis of lysosome-related organelles complex 1 subunit 5-like [Mytilus edulis]|uniref:biogenesis of lysosome-related organelles complex 1 subunit 5-like n=1 Tax=Mytilus edulis TaxID=6550 RepID=UPI0039F0941B
MIDQTIFKDVNEIHARLLDHRPVLQGHINHFVQEFEDKRQNREPERLQKVLDNVKEMNEKLIPESQKAMQVFLPDVSAKVKVATEMCRKIEDGELLENKQLLQNRASRKERWDEFLKKQYHNCDEIDTDFNQQVERLKTHYEDLEDKLGYSTMASA